MTNEKNPNGDNAISEIYRCYLRFQCDQAYDQMIHSAGKDNEIAKTWALNAPVGPREFEKQLAKCDAKMKNRLIDKYSSGYNAMLNAPINVKKISRKVSFADRHFRKDSRDNLLER